MQLLLATTVTLLALALATACGDDGAVLTAIDGAMPAADGAAGADGSPPGTDGAAPDGGGDADGAVPGTDGGTSTVLCGRSFDDPTRLEASDETALLGAVVAGAGDGRFVVVFGQDSSPTEIQYLPYAAFHDPSSGWSAPELLGGTDNAYELQAGFDASGAAYVAWLEEIDGDGTRRNVWAARASSGAAFAPAAMLGTAPRYSGVLDLSVTEARDGAVLGWHRAPSEAARAAASTFDTTAGSWSAAATVSSTTLGTHPRDLRVAASESGAAAAVWRQDEGSGLMHAHLAYRDASGAWSAPMLLDAGGEEAFYPDVLVAPSGRALVVWSARAGSTEGASFYAHYDPASGLGAPVAYEAAYYLRGPVLASDGRGNAMVSFERGGTTYVGRYTPAAGFTTAEALPRGGGSFSIAFDGDWAVATWAEPPAGSTRTDVYARCWESAGGWSAPVLVERMDTSEAMSPSVAIAGTTAAVVWRQHDGTADSIWGALLR